MGDHQRPRGRWTTADGASMSAYIEGFRGFCTPRVGAAEFIFHRPIAARIGASAAEIWASEVRQAAPGHTTAATRSTRPAHGAAVGYRARCGGPIGWSCSVRRTHFELCVCSAASDGAPELVYSAAARVPQCRPDRLVGTEQRQDNACIWSAAVGNPTCVGAAAAGLRGVLPRVTSRKPSTDHHGPWPGPRLDGGTTGGGGG